MINLLCSFFLLISFSVKAQKIIVLGDSITEGYGVPAKSAYPELLKPILSKNFPKIELVTSAISGSVTASASSRLEWLLKNEKNIKAVIVVLGGNDLLRGIKPQITENNYLKIVKIAERENIPLLIAQMPIPMNYTFYQKDFDKMYKDLAKSKQVTLLLNFLRGIVGVSALNQTDGIHPNELGHKVIVQNISEQIIQWIKKISK